MSKQDLFEELQRYGYEADVIVDMCNFFDIDMLNEFVEFVKNERGYDDDNSN